ncbi:MAG: hypothetical protein IKL88_04130 [Erysipelotrichales bacterium]|nr:hypothetical protein [Erysipelotrichales bacterium]
MRKGIIFLLCVLLSGCSNNVTELENKITELESQVSELKTSLADVEAEKKNAEQELEYSKNEVELLKMQIVRTNLLNGDVVEDKRYVGTFYDIENNEYICFYASGYYIVFNLNSDVIEYTREGTWSVDKAGTLNLGIGMMGVGAPYKCTFNNTLMDCELTYEGTDEHWILEKVQLKK